MVNKMKNLPEGKEQMAGFLNINCQETLTSILGPLWLTVHLNNLYIKPGTVKSKFADDTKQAE